MTVKQIKDYLNYIINKDLKGNALSPAELNTLLKATNIDLFNRVHGSLNLPVQTDRKIFGNNLLSSDALAQFKVLSIWSNW